MADMKNVYQNKTMEKVYLKKSSNAFVILKAAKISQCKAKTKCHSYNKSPIRWCKRTRAMYYANKYVYKIWSVHKYTIYIVYSSCYI